MASNSKHVELNEDPKLQLDLIKLIIATILTTAIYILPNMFLNPSSANIWQLILASIVMFFCGWKFLKGGALSIVKRHPNMDLLVAVATIITYGYSVYIAFSAGHPYFDVCCTLIVFISLGELFETGAKIKSRSSLNSIKSLIPTKINTISGVSTTADVIDIFNNDKNFSFWPKKPQLIKVGDYIFIPAGSAIPADGVIICGNTEVDESMLTGESNTITKLKNDFVAAGTKNIKSDIAIKVSQSPDKWTITQILNAIKEAQKSKVPVARVADKVASIFVPVVLLITAVVFAFWFFMGGPGVLYNLNQGIMAAVSVLVVACPCALVLAVPITISLTMAKAADLGIIVRDGAVLEALPKLNHFLFDKTGTLTFAINNQNGNAQKTLRPSAKQTIKWLQKSNNSKTYILSGDNKDETIRISQELGIPTNNVAYELDPIGKKEFLANLMRRLNSKKDKKKNKFAFLGDGVNDAPVMTLADVGITIESASSAAIDSCDVLLMSNKLNDLIKLIKLSKLSMKKIKQNIFFALAYNVVLIPLAAFNCILPVFCGVIHAVATLIVVVNAVLIIRFK